MNAYDFLNSDRSTAADRKAAVQHLIKAPANAAKIVGSQHYDLEATVAGTKPYSDWSHDEFLISCIDDLEDECKALPQDAVAWSNNDWTATILIHDLRVPAFQNYGEDYNDSLRRTYEDGATDEFFCVEVDEPGLEGVGDQLSRGFHGFQRIDDFQSKVLDAITGSDAVFFDERGWDEQPVLRIGNGFDGVEDHWGEIQWYEGPCILGEEPIGVYRIRVQKDAEGKLVVVDHDLPERLPAVPAAAKVDVTLDGESLAFVRSVLNGGFVESADLHRWVCETFGPAVSPSR